MTLWILMLVALAAASGARGSRDDLCARMCPRSPPQCPAPCPPVHCPAPPQIPACPTPLVNLSCPSPTCPTPTCPTPTCPTPTCPKPSCPTPTCPVLTCPPCPPSPKCTVPRKVVPHGYRTAEGLGSYRLYQEKMNWENANITCTSSGGYLAIPNNLDELIHLLNMMYNHDIKFLHVGMHDNGHENEFFTVLGQPMDAAQRTMWYDGEPNGGTEHNCVYLHKEKRRILDEPCQDKESFVCEA